MSNALTGTQSEHDAQILFSDWISKNPGKHFWGICKTENGKFYITSTHVEENTIQIQDEAKIEITVPENSGLENGIFVVGFSYRKKPYLEKNKAFMLRQWEEFKESEQYKTLESYLQGDEGQDRERCYTLSPKFQTIYPNLIVSCSGHFYAGFKWEGQFYSVTTDNVLESTENILDFNRIIIYNSGEPVQFNEDSFILLNGKESAYLANETFLSDGDLWKRCSTLSNGHSNVNRDAQDDGPTEIGFLTSSLFPYVERCRFSYSKQDIVRFHTSVKCGMLTLLGGAPGTGKSSLVELYFRALGGRGNNGEKPTAFCRVDVNPSWMEPADLLGYKDAKGVFQPADNGLYEFLTKNGEESANKQNNQDKDSLRLVCLEEINLACVEHYFSDFIQIISRGGGCLSIAGKAPAIVNEQVRIVGTCNSDETTHSMSLRLLDRCNYIELDMGGNARKKLYTSLFSQPAAKPLPFSEGGEITSRVYNSWRCANSGNAISKTITDTFWALFQHFEAAGIAPSPRVMSEIVTYIHNRPSIDADGKQIPENEDGKRQWLAFDECVAQRILSQYRASPGTIAAWTVIGNNLGDNMPLSKRIVVDKGEEYRQMTAFASL